MAKDGMANFFLGFGIGVGVGLLFAPKTGEETRDLLMNKADEAKENLKKQTEGLRESASEFVDKSRDAIKTSASDLVDKGREVINRQRDTLSDAIQAGKQAYREKIDANGAEMPSGL